MPVGAFGGRRDIMSHIAPLGPVYQAGTLSGNPVAMAARASRRCTGIEAPGFHARLAVDDRPAGERHCAARRATGRRAARDQSRLRHVRPVLHRAPTGELLRRGDGLRRRDASSSFFHGMLAEGVYLAPSAFEAGFVSAAHTDREIDATVAAAATGVQDTPSAAPPCAKSRVAAAVRSRRPRRRAPLRRSSPLPSRVFQGPAQRLSHRGSSSDRHPMRGHRLRAQPAARNRTAPRGLDPRRLVVRDRRRHAGRVLGERLQQQAAAIDHAGPCVAQQPHQLAVRHAGNRLERRPARSRRRESRTEDRDDGQRGLRSRLAPPRRRTPARRPAPGRRRRRRRDMQARRLPARTPSDRCRLRAPSSSTGSCRSLRAEHVRVRERIGASTARVRDESAAEKTRLRDPVLVVARIRRRLNPLRRMLGRN